MSKRAILAASFGTSHRDTCEKNIAAIERDIASAFPEYEVRRAFTSGMIIRKLQKRDNIRVDTVAQALEKLAAEGFEEVVLQPTHVLNGVECEGVAADARPYAAKFKRFAIGAPLLSAPADYTALAKAISVHYPARPGTALCLMGHGTAHHANSAYPALDYHFKLMGRPDIFVGTVEGFPDLDTLLEQVAAFAPKRVVLVPLMVVAGDHAKNDMAGSDADSWKSRFESTGCEVACVLKGLGESPAIREIYVAHVRDALA